MNTISFEAEVKEVRAKLDGIDRMYRVVLETNQPAVLALEKFIAEDTIHVEVKNGK